MTSPLSGANVVLGVTGGIAAYKAAEVASRLRKAGAQVDVVMTENATRFVAPLTFSSLTGRAVVWDTFAPPEKYEVEHVALAQRARLFIVAPATANILAKMAHGIADDMLSTTLLATRAPVLVAPAMNTGMWEAPATRENLRTLMARGVHVVGPDSGRLACGDSGAGRMSEPQAIVEAALALLSSAKDMRGLRVLVTAGPTRERIDPVRFLTNDSSGKMGYALAEAAAARGAAVTLLSGPVALETPRDVARVDVQSTGDLLREALLLCGEQDVIVQAAAPADYTVAEPAAQKIKKADGEPLLLRLEETPDVARDIGERRQPGQTLVGFAAETDDVEARAKEKLRRKGLDMIVANDVTLPGAGFNVDTNIATLITASDIERLPLMPKRALADVIFDRVLALRAARDA